MSSLQATDYGSWGSDQSTVSQTRGSGVFSLPPKVPPQKQTNPKKVYAEEIAMTGGTQSRRRAVLYTDAWLKSRAPNPNLAVTMLLSREFRNNALAAGLSAPKAIQNWLYAPIRTALSRQGVPFLWIGVIEIDSGEYHVHGLLNMPSDEMFLRGFLPAWKKLAPEGLRSLAQFESYYKLDRSGTPIHAHRISDYLQYNATGGAGAAGWLDYMTKALDQTASSRGRKWPADRAISISRAVTRLVDRKSFGRHALRYSLN
ncbi:hypothetical protein [uncultured Roseibium sp.]|uniref:hypothetical protein n=1 Tax=uncultured Roseibium sp. TaxID=1936171 RepID=UPI002623E2CB|nr:hypothetical protein [uncultured Roseibium sp.]